MSVLPYSYVEQGEAYGLEGGHTVEFRLPVLRESCYRLVGLGKNMLSDVSFILRCGVCGTSTEVYANWQFILALFLSVTRILFFQQTKRNGWSVA